MACLGVGRLGLECGGVRRMVVVAWWWCEAGEKGEVHSEVHSLFVGGGGVVYGAGGCRQTVDNSHVAVHKFCSMARGVNTVLKEKREEIPCSERARRCDVAYT